MRVEQFPVNYVGDGPPRLEALVVLPGPGEPPTVWGSTDLAPERALAFGTSVDVSDFAGQPVELAVLGIEVHSGSMATSRPNVRVRIRLESRAIKKQLSIQMTF